MTVKAQATRSRAILDEIDFVLTTAPSMDTDYGFGAAVERCAVEGLCWRCMDDEAVDEISGTGLCEQCIAFLRWYPPEREPAPSHACSEWCECRAWLAEVCFRALREAQRPVGAERVPKWRRFVRAMRRGLR